MANDVAEKKLSDSAEKRKMVASLAKALNIDIDPDQYAAEVLRTGDKVILPEGASIPEVIKVLQAEYDSERQKVSVHTTVPVPPWDGAMALSKAITNKLGLVQAVEIPGGWFSPDQPPTEIEVEYELGKTMAVRWGRFTLPGMGDAIAETSMQRDETSGEFNFTCKITTVRRWQKRAREILDLMREYAMSESIHKGKAFSIQFYNADGDQIKIPTPKFFEFNKQTPVFRSDLEQAIDRNIYTVIRHADDLKAMGESLKRGVLFAGSYGTGKTMLASAIANVAVQYGWTFIYVKDSAELPLALQYAKKFQPVVVFCEDVDRVAGKERSDDVNNLLNQLDGVDSKSAAIMTILTSNHSDKVNVAMRRPGRIDMVLQVLPPDSETISRMVKVFVGDGLEPNSNLEGIGATLTGFAPAYIREACGRARLEALRRTGNLKSLINGDDLATVAAEVKAEKEMFVGSGDDTPESTAQMNSLADGLTAAGKIMKSALTKAGQGITTTTRQ